jgi:hypothetical protein
VKPRIFVRNILNGVRNINYKKRRVIMSKILTLLSVGTLFTLMACNGQVENKSEHQHKEDTETTVAVDKAYYYTCPMEQHKHISSDKPGDCSECGMKLVAAVETGSDSAEYYGCPMPSHSHIRHEKAGKCEECNMQLKAMSLKTN